MGTLFEQPPRRYRDVSRSTEDFIAYVHDLARQFNLPFDSVLKAIEVQEMERRTSILVDNGDIWDEQIAGIGKLLGDLIDAIDYRGGR